MDSQVITDSSYKKELIISAAILTLSCFIYKLQIQSNSNKESDKMISWKKTKLLSTRKGLKRKTH